MLQLTRIEELENTKMKLQARLAECEGTVDNLNNKLVNLEKSKAQLQVTNKLVDLKRTHGTGNKQLVVLEKRE